MREWRTESDGRSGNRGRFSVGMLGPVWSRDRAELLPDKHQGVGWEALSVLRADVVRRLRR